jgi:hypothetical protein
MQCKGVCLNVNAFHKSQPRHATNVIPQCFVNSFGDYFKLYVSPKETDLWKKKGQLK